MPAAVGLTGNYLWRDGTVSTLAPPSAGLQEILDQPTMFVPGDGLAVSYDNIYETQPFVAAACMLIAGQISRLPLKCYATKVIPAQEATDLEEAKPERRQRVRDRESMLAQAIRNPAPRRSAHALKWDIALDLCVNGNHLERITFIRGRMYLTRIPWRFVQPILNDAKDTILGWKIQRPGEDEETLSNIEVIHFAEGSTLSGLGVSPLKQLGTSIHLDAAAQQYQIATMRNQARLGSIVSIDGAYYKDSEIRESIREEFTSRYTGPANAGKPFVATGVTVHSVPQQTVVEAELIAQRMISREEVSAVYGPATLFLGDSSKATQNNVGEMHKQLHKTTLAVKTDLIQETFAAQIIEEHPIAAPADGYVEFDPSAILSGDPLERAKTYRELEASGAITINEVRERENLPLFDAPWANEPMLPANNLQPASLAFGGAAGEVDGQDPEAEPEES